MTIFKDLMKIFSNNIVITKNKKFKGVYYRQIYKFK